MPGHCGDNIRARLRPHVRADGRRLHREWRLLRELLRSGSRKIGTASRLVVAAPAYIDRYSEPRHPRELSAHECIYHSGIGNTRVWTFYRHEQRITIPINDRLHVNTSEAVR